MLVSRQVAQTLRCTCTRSPLRPLDSIKSVRHYSAKTFQEFKADNVSAVKHEVRRFWKAADFANPKPDVHGVTLDGRSLKNMRGTNFELPSKELAAFIALEWDTVHKVARDESIPLTMLAWQAEDYLSKEANRSDTIKELLRFVDTDAVCYHHEFPEGLVQLQDEKWNPVIAWIREHEGLDIVTTTGITPIKQSEKTKKFFESYMRSLNAFELAGYERLVRSSKSVLIAHALVKGQINLEQASQAAQLELVYQTKNWGEVEDGHDTDMRETTIRMGDGLLFIKYGKAASEL